MPQVQAFQPSQALSQGETCANCPQFQDFHDARSRGWCQAFDQPARTYHPRTRLMKISVIASIILTQVLCRQLKGEEAKSIFW